MPTPPNTPGNPWLIKGIIAFIGAVGLTIGGLVISSAGVITTTQNIVIDSDTSQLQLGDSQNVGISFSSAGVAQITDGSTGNGDLKFKNNVTSNYLAAVAALSQ
jgi:hypothetical protein